MSQWTGLVTLLERGALEDADAMLRRTLSQGDAPANVGHLSELTQCLQLARLWRELAQEDLWRLLRDQRSLRQAQNFDSSRNL